MLAKRIIPCLDVTNGRVVKGKQFVNLVDTGDPVLLGEYYSQEGADELIFLDITASYEKRKNNLDLIEKIAKRIFIPFTVGGGISTVNDIRNTLLAGADKVSINSAAVKNSEIIFKSANIFGSQCIAVAIDAKKINGKYIVFINGGRINTGIDVLTWAKKVATLGAGEILLTSIDADGEKKGFDTKLTKLISTNVSIPVIASGGAGKGEDFFDVFADGKADAALAASIFHFKENSIANIKKYLQSQKIVIRN